MKGCLYKKEKVKFHQVQEHDSAEKSLDIAVSDLAAALLPDLTIIDGTVGMQGMGPSSGDTVYPGFITAGADCIAVDSVTASMMGFSPDSIPILYLSAERGAGTCSPDEIDIVPHDEERPFFNFEPPPLSLDFEYEGVYVYDAGACSGCMSTLMVFLKRHESALRDMYGDHSIHIYLGSGNDPEHTSEHDIFIGKCTRRHEHSGIFIEGCPPVASQIFEKIQQHFSG